MELALGYRIFQENYKFTAENYQIMNYGFGGSISVHLDANNDVSDNDISNEETDIIEIKPSIISRWRKNYHCHALLVRCFIRRFYNFPKTWTFLQTSGW